MAPKWLAGAVFVALSLVPLMGSEYWTDQATRYILFGLFAMSLSLVWGRGGMLCFGHAMFFGIGGYAMAVVTIGMLGITFGSTYSGLLFSTFAATLFAVAIGYFLFWGRGLTGAYLAIVTLAIAFILEQVIKNWYVLGADNGLSSVPMLDFSLFGRDLKLDNATPRFYFILCITVLIYVVLDWLLKSRWGLLISAVKTNPERLAFLGYSVFLIRLAIFSLGAAIAGLAGALFVAVDEFASPTLIGFALSAEVLIWVALGGRDMILAAFIGVFMVRVMESYFSEWVGDMWLLLLGIVFMVSVVLFPRGLVAAPITRIGKIIR